MVSGNKCAGTALDCGMGGGFRPCSRAGTLEDVNRKCEMCNKTLPIRKGKPRRFCNTRCRDRHFQDQRRKATKPPSDERGPRLQRLDTLIAAGMESTPEGREFLAYLQGRT